MENNNVQNVIHGFKAFNPDWTCRGVQYKVGEIYEMNEPPICCKRGYHFCLEMADCFNHYDYDSRNKVAEVIALGEVDSEADSTKYCTNKIKIVREIPWDEVQNIVNTGKDCTGLRNTGNRNAGDWNTGNRNAGDRNTGDWNTGNRNTGNRNAGNRNTGDRNTGNCNTGNHNTGDWNSSSFNTGCFMTEEQKIYMFNKPSDWTYGDWLQSRAREVLCGVPKNTTEWVFLNDMTNEEKRQHPECETTGGYLRTLHEHENAQLWWDSLPDGEKDAVTELPNFDSEIFRQCTGINVGEQKKDKA